MYLCLTLVFLLPFICIGATGQFYNVEGALEHLSESCGFRNFVRQAALQVNLRGYIRRTVHAAVEIGFEGQAVDFETFLGNIQQWQEAKYFECFVPKNSWTTSRPIYPANAIDPFPVLKDACRHAHKGDHSPDTWESLSVLTDYEHA